MAQLLAHNMSLTKPVSAWPKGAGFNVTGGFNAYYIVASGCTPFPHYYSGVARRLLEARAFRKNDLRRLRRRSLTEAHLHYSGPQNFDNCFPSPPASNRFDGNWAVSWVPPHSPSLGWPRGHIPQKGATLPNPEEPKYRRITQTGILALYGDHGGRDGPFRFPAILLG
jgi:hypothetical protein